MSQNTAKITVDGVTYQVTPHTKKEVGEVLARFKRTAVRVAKPKPKAEMTLPEVEAKLKELGKLRKKLKNAQ